MKTVLFVPGFRESMYSRNYRATIEAIKAEGYLVRFVQINWVRTTIDDWSKELESIYSEYDPSNTILAGFSYGAVTVSVCAAKKSPSELWLFSLSPYFSDDMPHMKTSWLKEIGSRRTKTFSKLIFEDIAHSINCKTFILAGEKEIKKYPLIGNRSVAASKLIKNSNYSIVKGSDHDVTDTRYISEIRKLISHHP